MSGGAFRRSEWDPRHIITQMLVMQSVFYLASSTVWLFIAMLTGRSFSVDTLLSWEVVVREHTARRFDAASRLLPLAGSISRSPHLTRAAQVESELGEGEAGTYEEARAAGGGANASLAVNLIATLVIALFCGLALVPVVGRAKQCWDFAATVYIMDLLACTLYTRFPKVTPSAAAWTAPSRAHCAHRCCIPERAAAPSSLTRCWFLHRGRAWVCGGRRSSLVAR